MNSRILFILFLTLAHFPLLFSQTSAPFSSSIDASDWCGSNPSPEAYAFMTRTRAARTAYLDNASGRNTATVNVQIYIIRDTDGSDGISSSQAESALAQANTEFAGANIHLEQCGPIVFINNSTYSSFESDTEIDQIRAQYDVKGAINLYFAKTVTALDNQGNVIDLCGRARFPDGNPTGFAVVANSCYNLSTTHELGHVFGLMHTHQGYNGNNPELVTRGSGANCDTKGDQLCDTPADPKLTNLVNSNCNYTGNATDANGDAYTPDASNIMSYSLKACRTTLTAGQLSNVSYSAANDYPADGCLTACFGSIADFPYSIDMENPLLFFPMPLNIGTQLHHDVSDDRNWTRHSGTTGSSGTGPSGAHSGDFYIYTEASSNFNKTYGAVTNCFNFTSKTQGALSFWYHMYGSSHMGKLLVQATLDGGDTWMTLDSIEGNQGNSWQEATVDLSDVLGEDAVRFRFWGVTGSGYKSDICIDDITVDASPHYASFPYSTDFNSGSFDKHWETSSSNSFGRVRVTDEFGPKGSHHMTMDVHTSFNYATNEARLYVAAGGNPLSFLKFDWKDVADESHAADGVFLSNDGGANFTKIYDLTGGSGYQTVVIDLFATAIAHNLPLTNETVIKFQQYDNYKMNRDGIAIDNVSIYSPFNFDEAEEHQLIANQAATELNTPTEPEVDPQEALEEAFGVNCYPNPFRDAVNVEVPKEMERVDRIQLLSLNGQVIEEYRDLAGGQTIQMGGELARGMYLVRAEHEGRVDVVKVAKMK